MDDWLLVEHDDNLMTTGDLVGAGYDDKAIARLVSRGELRRIRHGAYAPAAAWHELDERSRRVLTSRAVLRNARTPTILTAASAADAFGVPVWDMGTDTHVARLDAKADRREAGRAPHRGVLRAEDVTRRSGMPVTSGTRTALDVITTTDTEHALVIVDGLLRAGETTIAHLERRGAAMAHDPHSLKLPIVLQRADGRHESAGESRTAWFLSQHGLPRPVPQLEIRDRSGRVVARVDFAFPEHGVFLEFDGKVKYLRHRRPGESVSDAVLREKRREELICGLTGWRCVRLVWSDLYLPDRTTARIRATLAGHLWAA